MPRKHRLISFRIPQTIGQKLGSLQFAHCVLSYVTRSVVCFQSDIDCTVFFWLASTSWWVGQGLRWLKFVDRSAQTALCWPHFSQHFWTKCDTFKPLQHLEQNWRLQKKQIEITLDIIHNPNPKTTRPKVFEHFQFAPKPKYGPVACVSAKHRFGWRKIAPADIEGDKFTNPRFTDSLTHADAEKLSVKMRQVQNWWLVVALGSHHWFQEHTA